MTFGDDGRHGDGVVVDMEVDKVADEMTNMEVDKVADMKIPI